MQNTTGKLMEQIVARAACSGLRSRKVLPRKKGTEQENYQGTHSLICIQCLWRIPEEGTSSGWCGQSGRCIQQMEPLVQYGAWCSQVGSQQHSWKERLLPCDLETGSPCPNNWQRDFHKAPPVASSVQCLHKGTGWSEQQWFKPGAYACGRHAHLQNSQWHPHSSHHLVPRDSVRNQSKQGASPVVRPQQQCSRTSNVSSLLQWRSHRTHELSQIPWDLLWQNADVQDAGQINKTQMQERTICVESHGWAKQCHRFLLYQSVILSVTDYGLGLITLSQSTQQGAK